VAEDNSPAQCENQAMAIRRYVEQELGVTDPDKLHVLFVETYELLNDGTPFDEQPAAE
jgi:isopentenyldiphosphate isomerase